MRTNVAVSLVAAWGLIAVAGCGDDTRPMPDAGADAALDGAPDGGPNTGPDFLSRLAGFEDYGSLSGAGAEVKYLARVDGRDAALPDECLFQNTHRFPFHVQFLRTFAAYASLDFDTYLNLVLRGATRVYWGGGLKVWAAVRHPKTAVPGVITYTLYREQGPGEALSVDQLVEVDQRLKACAPFARDLLVLLPETPDQEAEVRPLSAALAERGVNVVYLEDLRRGLGAEGYSLGEGYGYLRVVPMGDSLRDYGPRDVVVVESAPNDISIVAGLVTRNPQSLHSHVNLRLQEKRIPNAAVTSIYDNTFVLGLRDRLVHIEVKAADVVLEPAALEEAEAFWRSRMPMVEPVRSDLSVTALAGFDAINAEAALAYGVKAANLAELRALLAGEHRNDGFAVPFSAYRDHVIAHGIGAEIDALLGDERLRTDAAFRRDGLSRLRRLIREAPLAAALVTSIVERARGVLGSGIDTTRLRFRSSTNAEDLDQVSGAGLYNSRSGCIADELDGDELGPSKCLGAVEEEFLRGELSRRIEELVQHPDRSWLRGIIEELEEDLADEKTISNAVRGVWASLWNDRAFEDRDYYGIAHRDVYMGLAVHPSFAMERAEAVAVTNLRPDGGDPVYRLVSQVGDVGVVRPTIPTAVPETLTFRRGASGAHDRTIQVRSSLAGDGAQVWSDAHLDTIAALLFQVQDHFAANVYGDIADLRLDLEIEHTFDGRVVVKQVRPFVGPTQP